MSLALLAALAATVLSTALSSGQVPHPDAHHAIAATNRPPAHVVDRGPVAHVDDGALD